MNDIHISSVELIMARLGEIRMANSYNTDSGQLVRWNRAVIVDGRAEVGSDTEIEDYPYITVNEQDVSFQGIEDAKYPNIFNEVRLLIVAAFVAAEDDEFLVMHHTRIDLIRALKLRTRLPSDVFPMGGFLKPISLVMQSRQQGFSESTVQLTVQFRYPTCGGLDHAIESITL